MNYYALTALCLILGLSLGAYGGHVNGYKLGLHDGENRLRAQAVEQGWGCYYLRFRENEPVWVFRFGKYMNGRCEDTVQK